MNLNDYQTEAMTADILGNGSATSVTEPAYIAKVLGLVGEAGEVAEKYKKIIRDKKGSFLLPSFLKWSLSLK